MLTKENKNNIVWYEFTTKNGKNKKYHGCYTNIRFVNGNKQEGNSVVCNKKFGVKDGDKFLKLSEIKKLDVAEELKCKSCLQNLKKK